MALWNSPLADGAFIRQVTLPPPPDCPKMVTLSGSPPNWAMFCFTHCKAATKSSKPALPDPLYLSPYAERSRKPKTFKRWFTETSTTPFLARFSPSYEGSSIDDPAVKPPPCSHIITGRFLLPCNFCVHTFSVWQCSLGYPRSWLKANSNASLTEVVGSVGQTGP